MLHGASASTLASCLFRLLPTLQEPGRFLPACSKLGICLLTIYADPNTSLRLREFLQGTSCRESHPGCWHTALKHGLEATGYFLSAPVVAVPVLAFCLYTSLPAFYTRHGPFPRKSQPSALRSSCRFQQW